MNTKQLNRILTRAMYGMVIAAMVFSVTGTVSAEDEEIPLPPRIYANLTDDSIRYELAAPYDSVRFEIYASQGGELLMPPITKDADETGFVWISIWEHHQDLVPGNYIVVSDSTNTKDLVVELVSIDVVDAEENILVGKAPEGSFVWVVANNDHENCGVSIEVSSGGIWQFDFDDLGCDIASEMAFYAQVMDDEDDTSEANTNFIDGWHDGAEGIGHANSCNVSGFALDTNDRERNLQISILSDGMEVVSTSADLAWDDLIGVCGDDGSCGFYVNLWGLISNYEEHQITVQARDEETGAWVDLGGTPRTLTCVNYDLYVLNVKTGEVERLTTTLENTGEYNPSWSNDGKKVVHDVADADSHNLYITDVKTHISMLLKGGEGGNDAVWSPNGKWIVFDRRWYDDPNLYILPSKGGTPQLVVENAVNGDWSPDGQRLVFERSDGIWTASVGGDDENQVAMVGYSPAWSPDGMWIAYDLDGDIWKVEVDEYGSRVGDPIQLTSGPVGEAGPTWSQNSDSIAFISDASGDYDIWKIPADGGMPVQLRGAIGFDEYDPAYSNNGQYIAYEGATEPSVPHVEADAWQDSYVLADWPTGQAINVSIDDPGTSKKPDFRTAFTPDGSTNGYFFQPGLNIEPGYIITAASKFFTKTLTVTELAATYIDAVNGIVAGIAPPNSDFYMVTDGDHFQVAIGENIMADENGDWTADLSGYDTPLPWTWYTGGEMWQWDDDGDITHARWHVHQEVVEVWLRYNEIRAFDWPLGATLTFSVNDVEIATAPTEPLTWMDGTGAVVNAGDQQLEPGMTVTVTDGTTTKEMVIQDIRITNIDIENDVVYGYAPGGANLELGSWEDSPVYRFFNADADGNWMIDYRVPSLNGVTVDLNPGDDLRLFLRDEEKDATVWEAYGPNTRFTVWPDWNYLEGYEWPDGALVSISVADKETCSTDATSAFPDWDPWNTFFSVNFPENCDVGAGDFITLSYESLSLTHQIQEMTITDVNIDDNTVTGTAIFDSEQYIFHTWIHEVDGSYMQLSADGGTWLADFGSLGFDLQPGMGGRVELVDQASNATAVDWHIPLPTFAAYMPGAIEGYDWPMGHKIALTINDGEPLYADSEQRPDFPEGETRVLFEIGQYEIYLEIDDHIVMVDLETGFFKELWVADLQVTEINQEDKTVSGIYDPERSFWTQLDGQDPVEIIYDGNTWIATFADMPPGASGYVAQDDWDHDGTVWDFYIPNTRFTVFPEWERFDGYDWPDGATVSITVDEKSECNTTSQESWGGFFNGGFPEGCDIAVGDFVTFTYGEITRNHTVQNVAIIEVNKEAGTVSGTADADLVYAWVHEYGYDMELQVEDGNWFADFGSAGLSPFVEGMGGRAEVRDEFGNGTAVDWYIPNPHFTVFPEWEWFDGYDWPDGATVAITVHNKPECATEGVSSGNFFNGGFPEGCDIAVGDFVTFKYGEIERNHTVQNVAITDVNKEAGTVSGTADADLVYAWVHEYGYDMELQVADGTWLADFGSTGLDLEEGMCGRAEIRDGFGNGTAADWCIPRPWLNAFPEWDIIYSYEWPAYSEVGLTINGQFVQTVTVDSTSWDPNVYTAYFEFGELYDLKPSDVIMLSGSGMELTYTVQNLTVTEVDETEDTISGTADPNAKIFAFPHATWQQLWVNADNEGNWQVDFTGVFDWVPRECGRAEIRDGFGNSTAVDWCIP